MPAAGYFDPARAAHIMVCGSAARHWFAGHGHGAQATLARLFAQGARQLILTADSMSALAAATAAFPGSTWASDATESTLVQHLRAAALERLPQTAVPGVMLEVYGLGVLLRGPSGGGKSGAALELLARGQRLVADDLVELRRIAPDFLLASGATHFRGFLAAPGLGIVDVGRLHGPDAVAERARVDLVISLPAPGTAPAAPEQRIHGQRRTMTLLGVSVPQLCAHPGPGCNLATWIEAACRDHWLRLAGYQANRKFLDRHHHLLTASNNTLSPCN